LFDRFSKEIDRQGFKVNSGLIVDGSFVEVPTQRNMGRWVSVKCPKAVRVRTSTIILGVDTAKGTGEGIKNCQKT